MYLISWLRNWWGKSLRRRLLASSIVTILFFLILLGALSFRAGQAGIRTEVNQRNDQLATLVAKDINAHFNNLWGNVRLFTRQLEESTAMLSLQARVMLELRRVSPLTYRALYLFDSEGHFLIHLADPLEDLLAIRDIEEIISRPSIPLIDELSTAYEAARTEGLFLSAAYVVGADQAPIIYVSIPVVAEQGPSSQTVVAEIDLRDIWRRVDEIHVGQTGRAFVVSQEGTIIAHPDRTYVGQPLAPELRPVLAGYEGRTEYTDPIGGARLLASYSPVGGQSGWGIVVEQERAEAFAPVNRIAAITLGVLLVAIGMATVVTILVARSITRPIQHLVEVTRTIAQTGNLRQNVAVEGHDEVGQLAATFNQMADRLHASLTELERRVDERTVELTETNEQLQQEITERKRAEETIKHLAYHDALTGLPNRRLFNDRLNLALAHTQRSQQKLAVMLFDLDHFKEVNDTLGHGVGDQLLQVVSERLTNLLRKGDTVARMGGDEFMLLLPEIAQMEDVAKVAQKILEALREPFGFDGYELHITTSIGIALYPDDGEDGDTLMKNADIAMYRAKDQGRDNYQSWQQ